MTKRKKLELFKRIRHPHAQSLITAISDILGFLFLMIFTCPALYKVEIHSSKNCLENGFFRLYLAGLICSILLLIGAICKAITPYFIYISFKIVFIIMFPTQLMHDGSYEKAKNSEHALALFYGGLVLFVLFNFVSIIAVVQGIRYLSEKRKKVKTKKISGVSSISTRMAERSIE